MARKYTIAEISARIVALGDINNKHCIWIKKNDERIKRLTRLLDGLEPEDTPPEEDFDPNQLELFGEE